MKSKKILLLAALLLCCGVFQSCNRSSDEVWDDTKSAGRQMGQGVRTLGGKHGRSCYVPSKNDFAPVDDESCWQGGSPYTSSGYNSNEYNDFVPLGDEEGELAMADTVRPSRHSPGESGSPVPSLEDFSDPSLNPQTAKIFRPIYFGYDESLIKGYENTEILRGIADYMNSHPSLYLAIEGHTDQRGPQSYNSPLGLRRSNSARTFLVNLGIDPDRIFTTTYGKDRLVSLEENENGWSQNRRDEFKIYER